jgi:hypothetical protein
MELGGAGFRAAHRRGAIYFVGGDVVFLGATSR